MDAPAAPDRVRLSIRVKFDLIGLFCKSLFATSDMKSPNCVRANRTKMWEAMVAGRQTHSGYFDNEFDAAA
jgi:hypothetical protein